MPDSGFPNNHDVAHKQRAKADQAQKHFLLPRNARPPLQGGSYTTHAFVVDAFLRMV